MEGLSFLGTSIYTLIIQNDEIILFVPSEKSVYRGAASPPNMERLFSLPFTAEEALSILCGRVPLCPHLEAEIHKDGDLFVLELVCLFNRWHQRISLDPFQLDPIELHITDHLGRVILNVTWSDFHSLGETRIPTQIQVEMPLKGNHLRLTYKELELNLPLSDERFHLQLPQDTEIHAL
jgi:hypothetical protein